MVLQSQSSLERIQEAFDELCRNIMEEELSDSGRTLRRRGLSNMKLSLSPMETRHESAIRVIVGQLGALGIRLKRLEEQLDPKATPVDPAKAERKDPLPTDTEQMFVDALETPEKPLTE